MKKIELFLILKTRLKKIALHGEADGTILAAAGLKRLGIESFPDLKFEHLPVDEMVPAPGQAAIAIQTRKEDEGKFSVLGHPETEKAVGLERMVLEGMGGGCQIAVGAYSDGYLFRFFHEKTGFLKLDMAFSDMDLTDELIRRVR